jgi:hypothetical protein
MLATLTSKNQLTLPRRVVSQFPAIRYFDVLAESGRIVLEPVNPCSLRSVQHKLAELGIDESDVGAAVKWARKDR